MNTAEDNRAAKRLLNKAVEHAVTLIRTDPDAAEAVMRSAGESAELLIGGVG